MSWSCSKTSCALQPSHNQIAFSNLNTETEGKGCEQSSVYVSLTFCCWTSTKCKNAGSPPLSGNFFFLCKHSTSESKFEMNGFLFTPDIPIDSLYLLSHMMQQSVFFSWRTQKVVNLLHLIWKFYNSKEFLHSTEVHCWSFWNAPGCV